MFFVLRKGKKVKMKTWIKGLLCFVFAVAAAVSLYAFYNDYSLDRVMSVSFGGYEKVVNSLHAPSGEGKRAGRA